jgi:hypothetical protein
MMRFLQILTILVVASLTLFIASDTEVAAQPGAGGLLMFSVSTFDATHDITPAFSPGPFSCTSADVLMAPGAGLSPCAARVAPAPAGPVPSTNTLAPPDLGLNMGGAFTDDLNSLSFGEPLNVDPIDDWIFSVDQIPADGGATTGPAPGPCAAPNVSTEAAGAQAQGDIFMLLGAAPGCNVQAIDEAPLGLIAPTAPGVAPLDNLDALAELPAPTAGPCTMGTPGAPVPVRCAAMTVAPGSAVLGAIPGNACGGGPANAATILVPPGTPPIPPCLPGGCPAGGTPCKAVNEFFLGLVPGDNLDALCWFDGNGNMVPDRPQFITPGVPGDYYVFSLGVGSPSWPSPADLLRPTATGLAVVAPAPMLGLLPTDNVDALLCHNLDGDGDLVPTFMDNCPTKPNGNQSNVDMDTFGDACDTEGPPGNTNGLGGADDCLDGVDNDGSGAADAADPNCPDTDGDGVIDAIDNCPLWANPTQALPPWPIPAGDADCDGFRDTVGVANSAAETYIGTDPLAHCASTGAQNDEPSPDAWPVDFNDNRLVNGQDVAKFQPAYNKTVAGGPYGGLPGERYDYSGNGIINGQDIAKFQPYYNKTCA